MGRDRDKGWCAAVRYINVKPAVCILEHGHDASCPYTSEILWSCKPNPAIILGLSLKHL